MADFSIKRGDSAASIVATLSDKNGPINLSTATSVTLLFKTAGAGSTTFQRTCTITSAAGGVVTYALTLADAATGPISAVNQFNIEWEILWGDNRRITVPTNGFKTLEVTQDLGDAP